MAFMKNIYDLRGILTLVLLTLPSIVAHIDCDGKPFHCLNSTHFMICVDLGSGVSSTIDDFIIPCPPTTVCQGKNRFECEFLEVPTYTTTDTPVEAPLVTSVSEIIWTETTPFNEVTSIPFEEYFNTLSSTTVSDDVLFTKQTTVTESIPRSESNLNLKLSESISSVTETVQMNAATVSILDNTIESIADASENVYSGSRMNSSLNRTNLVQNNFTKEDVSVITLESNSNLSENILNLNNFVHSDITPIYDSVSMITESLFTDLTETTTSEQHFVTTFQSPNNTALPDNIVDNTFETIITEVTELMNLTQPESNLPLSETIPNGHDTVPKNFITPYSTSSSVLSNNTDAIVRETILPDASIIVEPRVSMMNENENLIKTIFDAALSKTSVDVPKVSTVLNASSSNGIDADDVVTNKTENINVLNPEHNGTTTETYTSIDVVSKDATTLNTSYSNGIEPIVSNVNKNVTNPKTNITLIEKAASVDVVPNNSTLFNATSSNSINAEAIVTNTTENINVLNPELNATSTEAYTSIDVVSNNFTTLSALNRNDIDTELFVSNVTEKNLISLKANIPLSEMAASVDVVPNESTLLNATTSSNSIDTEAIVTDILENINVLKLELSTTSTEAYTGSFNALNSNDIDTELLLLNVTENVIKPKTNITLIEKVASVDLVANDSTLFNATSSYSINAEAIVTDTTENINVLNPELNATSENINVLNPELNATSTEAYTSINVVLNYSTALSALNTNDSDTELLVSNVTEKNEISLKANNPLSDRAASVDVVPNDTTLLNTTTSSNSIDTEAIVNDITENINVLKPELSTTSTEAYTDSFTALNSNDIDTEFLVSNVTENMIKPKSNESFNESPVSVDVMSNDSTLFNATSSNSIDAETIVTDITENINVLKAEPNATSTETYTSINVVSNYSTTLSALNTNDSDTELLVLNVTEKNEISLKANNPLSDRAASVDIVPNDTKLLNTTTSSNSIDTEAIVTDILENINVLKPELSTTSTEAYTDSFTALNSNDIIDTRFLVSNVTENMIKPKSNESFNESPVSVDVMSNDSTLFNATSSNSIDAVTIVTDITENINVLKPELNATSTEAYTSIDVVSNYSTTLSALNTNDSDTELLVSNVTEKNEISLKANNPLSDRAASVDVVPNDTKLLNTTTSSNSIDTEAIVTDILENINVLKPELSTTSTEAYTDSFTALNSNDIDTRFLVSNVTENMIKPKSNESFNESPVSVDVMSNDSTLFNATSSNSIDAVTIVTDITENINVLKPELNATSTEAYTSIDVVSNYSTTLSALNSNDFNTKLLVSNVTEKNVISLKAHNPLSEIVASVDVVPNDSTLLIATSINNIDKEAIVTNKMENITVIKREPTTVLTESLASIELKDATQLNTSYSIGIDTEALVTENINVIETKVKENLVKILTSAEVVTNKSILHNSTSSNSIDAEVTDKTDNIIVTTPELSTTTTEALTSIDVSNYTLLNALYSNDIVTEYLVSNVTEKNEIKPKGNITLSEIAESVNITPNDSTLLKATSTYGIEADAVINNKFENKNVIIPEPTTALNETLRSIDIISIDAASLNASYSIGIDTGANANKLMEFNVTEHTNVLKTKVRDILSEIPTSVEVVTNDSTLLNATSGYSINAKALVTDKRGDVIVIEPELNTTLSETFAIIDAEQNYFTLPNASSSNSIDTEGIGIENINLIEPKPEHKLRQSISTASPNNTESMTSNNLFINTLINNVNKTNINDIEKNRTEINSITEESLIPSTHTITTTHQNISTFSTVSNGSKTIDFETRPKYKEIDAKNISNYQEMLTKQNQGQHSILSVKNQSTSTVIVSELPTVKKTSKEAAIKFTTSKTMKEIDNTKAVIENSLVTTEKEPTLQMVNIENVTVSYTASSIDTSTEVIATEVVNHSNTELPQYGRAHTTTRSSTEAQLEYSSVSTIIPDINVDPLVVPSELEINLLQNENHALSESLNMGQVTSTNFVKERVNNPAQLEFSTQNYATLEVSNILESSATTATVTANLDVEAEQKENNQLFNLLINSATIQTPYKEYTIPSTSKTETIMDETIRVSSSNVYEVTQQQNTPVQNKKILERYTPVTSTQPDTFTESTIHNMNSNIQVDILDNNQFYYKINDKIKTQTETPTKQEVTSYIETKIAKGAEPKNLSASDSQQTEKNFKLDFSQDTKNSQMTVPDSISSLSELPNIPLQPTIQNSETEPWQATVATEPSTTRPRINEQPSTTVKSTLGPATELRITSSKKIYVPSARTNFNPDLPIPENIPQVTSPSINAKQFSTFNIISTNKPTTVPNNKVFDPVLSNLKTQYINVPQIKYLNVIVDQPSIEVTSTQPNTESWYKPSHNINMQAATQPNLNRVAVTEDINLLKHTVTDQTTKSNVVSSPETELINVPKIGTSQTTEQVIAQSSLDLNTGNDFIVIDVIKPIHVSVPNETGTHSGISSEPKSPRKSTVAHYEKPKASVEKIEGKKERDKPDEKEISEEPEGDNENEKRERDEAPESTNEEKVKTRTASTVAISKDSKPDMELRKESRDINYQTNAPITDKKLLFPNKRFDSTIGKTPQKVEEISEHRSNIMMEQLTPTTTVPTKKPTRVVPPRIPEESIKNMRISRRPNANTTNIKNSTVPDATHIISHNRSATNSLKFICKHNMRGRFSDNKDCRKFYICIGRTEPIEGICPNNTVFSELRKQCTKNLSHCVRNNQFQCISEGRFNDYLKDNIFYICVKNSVGKFIRFKLQCLSDYILNKTTIRCVLNTESSQSTSDISKDNSNQSVSLAKSEKLSVEPNKKKQFECKKEGKFPENNDCRKYYICKKTGKSQFRLTSKKCDSDELYHKDKKHCVDGDSYECK